MSERFTPEGEMKSPAEIFAIRKVNECGPQFADQYPQIAQDAAVISTLEIAQKYNVSELYGVNEEIARSIVKKALQTLLPQEQRREVFAPRLGETHREAGKKLYAEGKGLFGMSEEQKAQAHRRENKVKGGQALRDQNKGIFAMDQETRKENALKANASHENSWFGGDRVDGLNEAEYALELAENIDYTISSGPRSGFLDYRKLTDAINQRYSNERTKEATQAFFERIRAKRKKENKKPL